MLSLCSSYFFATQPFETLLTRFFITKKERPARQPRMGSVIERLFETVTTQLIHQLLGNTQATKKPRLLTREVDPKRMAVWTLPRFSARLCQYVYEVYDQMEHPALFMSPREAFAGAVQYLLERVPLTCDMDAFLKRWPWFAEGSVGCAGILRDWLVDAVTATLAQGGTSLTEEVLIRTIPHPARRVSLEMEARAGEHKVALHDSEGAKQFQARLQKPGKAANAEATPTQGSRLRPTEASIAEPASVTRPLPQISPKPTQPRVGQRAPERDPVGRTSVPSARKTSGCSFAEEIPVTLVQIEEVGVSRFECPACLAVREIRPKGDRVKFPSHPKRMTNTPNQGSRWVKRGSAWNLFDS
jgi:hypothetical protein